MPSGMTALPRPGITAASRIGGPGSIIHYAGAFRASKIARGLRRSAIQLTKEAHHRGVHFLRPLLLSPMAAAR
jgi:hypothetical protein